ncbi:MAG: ATP-binding protein [Anaerolineae bacterium]
MPTKLIQKAKKISTSVELDEDLAEILGLLSVMTSDMSSNDEYLNELVHGLVSFSGAQFSAIWLAFERGNQTIWAVGGSAGEINEDALRQAEIMGDQGILEQVWITKKPVFENCYAPQDTLACLYPADLSTDETISVMCAPILKGKNCFGLILVGSKSNQQFGASAFAGLQHAAAGAGFYLHNAGLLQQVSTLFYDLEYMIQEWTRDVSGRLEKVQENGNFLGKILTDLSHEFKTPIASLSLYLGLIQKKPDKSEQYLGTMKTVINRLEMLLDGVLDLSEFRLHTTRIELEAVELQPVFVEIANLFTNSPHAAEVDIVVKNEPSLWVMADKNYLLNAIGRLVDNAVKYGEGKEILLSAERKDSESKSQILIKVSDKGPGIPQKDANYIFNPFYRGYGVGQSTIFGAGLGLTYASEIVKSFGGSLRLGDNLGEGTVMEIRLAAATE